MDRWERKGSVEHNGRTCESEACLVWPCSKVSENVQPRKCTLDVWPALKKKECRLTVNILYQPKSVDLPSLTRAKDIWLFMKHAFLQLKNKQGL